MWSFHSALRLAVSRACHPARCSQGPQEHDVHGGQDAASNVHMNLSRSSTDGLLLLTVAHEEVIVSHKTKPRCWQRGMGWDVGGDVLAFSDGCQRRDGRCTPDDQRFKHRGIGFDNCSEELEAEGQLPPELLPSELCLTTHKYCVRLRLQFTK